MDLLVLLAFRCVFFPCWEQSSQQAQAVIALQEAGGQGEGQEAGLQPDTEALGNSLLVASPHPSPAETPKRGLVSHGLSPLDLCKCYSTQ